MATAHGQPASDEVSLSTKTLLQLKVGELDIFLNTTQYLHERRPPGVVWCQKCGVVRVMEHLVERSKTTGPTGKISDYEDHVTTRS